MKNFKTISLALVSVEHLEFATIGSCCALFTITVCWLNLEAVTKRELSVGSVLKMNDFTHLLLFLLHPLVQFPQVKDHGMTTTAWRKAKLLLFVKHILNIDFKHKRQIPWCLYGKSVNFTSNSSKWFKHIRVLTKRQKE